MFPVYEEKKKNLHIHLRTLAHASPHLHNSIEFIDITEELWSFVWDRSFIIWKREILQ